VTGLGRQQTPTGAGKDDEHCRGSRCRCFSWRRHRRGSDVVRSVARVGHWYPEAPFVSMVITYATVSVLGFGNGSINLGRFAAAFFIGLLAMLLVGMTISEVVHCSFDRNGCFNL
jgi:hypothetical protein